MISGPRTPGITSCNGAPTTTSTLAVQTTTTTASTTTTTTTTSPSKWLHLCWLIILIPCFIALLIVIKKRCKTPVNYSGVEMVNFGFTQVDEEPILAQGTAVAV